MEMRTGSCHCGAVKVSAPREAFAVVTCHCEDCQKLHGNFFAMLAAAADTVVFEGEDAIRWYDSSPSARRSFCGTCGSRIAKQPTGSDRLLLSMGLFGPHTGTRIRRQVFESSKPDWYDLPPTE